MPWTCEENVDIGRRRKKEEGKPEEEMIGGSDNRHEP
jgi:hypothetical protein